MITIGLTGGIGCGKSYVCHIMELLGAEVYNADREAKYIMINDKELITRIKEYFGESTYNSDGELNSEYLASIIFSDDTKREKLNSLVHPALLRHFKDFVHQSKKEIVVIEAAILIESGFYKEVDKVIIVSAETNLRLERTIQRDKTTIEQVSRRMEAQMDDQERLLYADFIIYNNQKDLILPQIVSILEKISLCS